MAAIAFFTLLTLTLTLSSTIHARESQFFNKFSNKESQPLSTNQQQQQQQPEFIPQSQDSGSYGLYGHESGQLPPSATTNLPENYNPVAYTTPIHSTNQDIPDEFKDPQPYHYNGETRLYNSEKQQEFTGTNMYNSEKQADNGRYYGGHHVYKSQKQGFEFDDARFTETEDGTNMYNSEKQAENERYRTSNNAYMYNPEKQGMSDTRFLENGKYYYDINMENPNLNTRGFSSRNEYNTQGYYGNNQNSYDRYHFNGGYQNPEDQFNP